MYNIKSPNKKKLKSGISSTVGGKLGGTSYKTASPYSIKINNMTNINGLSPLVQAAVGGEEEFHTSGLPEVLYNIEGKPFDTTTGGIDEGNFTEIRIEEETGLKYVEATEDAKNYKEGERLYLQDPNKVDEPEQPEQPIPQGVGPGGMDIPVGGVGPMEMQSPTKIYEDGKRRKNYKY